MKKTYKKAKSKQKISQQEYWQTISDIVLLKLTNYKKASDRALYMKALISLIKKANNAYQIIPWDMLTCFELKHGANGYKMNPTELSKKLKIPKSTVTYYANAAPCILSKFHWDLAKHCILSKFHWDLAKHFPLHEKLCELLVRENKHG